VRPEPDPDVVSAPLPGMPGAAGSDLPDEVPAGVRRRPRALSVALATAGLLAVTAASATVTVAVGRPDGVPQVVAAAPAATASAAASPSGAAASPSAAASSAAPTPAPTPSSTVHGTVSDGVHGGDLRYFLLPMPAGAESYGSADGTTLSTKDVADEFGNADEMPSILRSYGYRDDAAERRYRTADGTSEVHVRLLRFKSRQMAKAFADGSKYSSGHPFDIDGDSGAQGYMMKPEQEAWTGEMVGISFSGDIEYEVTVDVKGTPDKALLVDAMRRQRERLASGG
jgi:hypothetical protein